MESKCEKCGAAVGDGDLYFFLDKWMCGGCLDKVGVTVIPTPPKDARLIPQVRFFFGEMDNETDVEKYAADINCFVEDLADAVRIEIDESRITTINVIEPLSGSSGGVPIAGPKGELLGIQRLSFKAHTRVTWWERKKAPKPEK